jgi:hypothetical protein
MLELTVVTVRLVRLPLSLKMPTEAKLRLMSAV